MNPCLLHDKASLSRVVGVLACAGQRLPFIFAGGLVALAQLMLFTIKGAGAPIALD